jgi:hypothetical protein
VVCLGAQHRWGASLELGVVAGQGGGTEEQWRQRGEAPGLLLTAASSNALPPPGSACRSSTVSGRLTDAKVAVSVPDTPGDDLGPVARADLVDGRLWERWRGWPRADRTRTPFPP